MYALSGFCYNALKLQYFETTMFFTHSLFVANEVERLTAAFQVCFFLFYFSLHLLSEEPMNFHIRSVKFNHLDDADGQ